MSIYTLIDGTSSNVNETELKGFSERVIQFTRMSYPT